MTEVTEPIHVLITLPFDDDLLDTIRDVSDRINILHHPTSNPREIPDDVWSQAEVLYTLHTIPDPAVAPQLRWIQTHSAGVDRVLQQPLCQAEDVMLTTTSGIHATNMTEYVFMMMLAFGHRLPALTANKNQANWPDDRFETLVPLELRGSTVGIVGYGSIGREIAHIANAFGMTVLAVKRDVRQPADPDGYVLPGSGDPDGSYFQRLYPPEALVSMVRECDFVVITVPLTESTRGMFNADVLSAMRPTAFLINVGRGGVVDEVALLHALQNGEIAGAGMDVFESEPLPEDSPLWKLDNLIISPHIAGNTLDYDKKAVRLFAENMERYIARRDLLNVVDRTRGY